MLGGLGDRAFDGFVVRLLEERRWMLAQERSVAAQEVGPREKRRAVRFGQVLLSLLDIPHQIKHQTGPCLRSEPVQILEQLERFWGMASRHEMVPQMLEEVPIVRAGMPAVTTLRSVRGQQLVVQRRDFAIQRLGATDAVIVDQVVHRHAADAGRARLI